MKKVLFLITLIIFSGRFPCRLQAETSDTDAPPIKVSLISELSEAKPGDSFLAGVRLILPEKWHIYWKNSGQAGFPTKIEWTLPPSINSSGIFWPRPHIFKEPGDITTIGYKDEVVFVSRITIPPNWPKEKPLLLKARVSWLACKTVCIPGSESVELSLPMAGKSTSQPEEAALIHHYFSSVLGASGEQELLARYESEISKSEILSSLGSGLSESALSLWMALLFAFLGGLLLNIMPCVLPVLSIKALRFMNQGSASRKEVLKESLFYTFGILLSFFILAGLVAGLKTAGQDIGWGFQFQEPRFLIILSGIVVGFGLSLFGVYEFSILVPSRIEKLSRHSGWMGPFWEGLLVTTLATPCTAPFLGPALGFSFSQSPTVIFIFFSLIGAGLAAPYVLLAAFPQWTKILPPPGAWMERFKQLMGFPLLGTGIWLLWVLGRQAGNAAVIGTLVFLFSIGLGLWILKWGADAQNFPPGRWLARAFFLIIIVFSYVYFVEPTLANIQKNGPTNTNGTHLSDSILWRPFSLESLEKEMKNGKTVFVDFTADWCLTCQVNKKGALSSEKVIEAFDKNNIVTLRADWTNRNDEITRILKKLGRSGVPVYALFKDGDASHPEILPEVLTEGIILEALNR